MTDVQQPRPPLTTRECADLIGVSRFFILDAIRSAPARLLEQRAEPFHLRLDALERFAGEQPLDPFNDQCTSGRALLRNALNLASQIFSGSSLCLFPPGHPESLADHAVGLLTPAGDR
jgi:hypothetical protein